ncbi:nucleotide exchange factor GrpE [Beggiatoa leptomitoformis]|uniref:Protein GrpE n=1 Tax=Beggiatoa leptomitoformis TaxID=288004 RepID=A0A2N9YGQ8_9GAMM|nr:nucleotide exchange factor GrpE [Beggiatoa leptomitoformis]ALG69436.2 nucleotide exchange factor GrpE [Beggiatoa leptomitoformis]AUI69690.1 nucleotide exchange factor GrpE [Beggiatoa leptomitoformis]
MTTTVNDKTIPSENQDALVTESATVIENDAPALDIDAQPTNTDSAPPLTVEELNRQLIEATRKAEENWDALLRQKAEFDNMRKRMERDIDNARKYALEKFATELLPIKDSMELGIEATQNTDATLNAIAEGMELTLKMLAGALEKAGIQEIHPQNEKFNPQFHEAMAMQPVPNVEDNTVIFVHQKGYQLNDRLLRPARVVVAKAAK